MDKSITKVPETNDEIERCHEIREYVLRESFSDVGMKLNNYNKNHPVHGAPNVSLIYIVNNEVIGSVRMDKKYEHLNLPDGEVRLALFAINPSVQKAGHGRKFFEEIKEWCKENSIYTIHTNSRPSSHIFWSKVGFEDNTWDEKGLVDSEIQMTIRL
ncbi:MAG: hypothetical protein CME70_11505 [Halobacteriovorax sp.]|nr:hypothetical protein [Halobacteriovorax sp.]|tara:strand:- start:55049 stop:55519 length:471 start_codon:yes stop_codon:yes gene_type:complete